MTVIADQLHAVRARIAAACHAAGRDPSEVGLLAVSKTFGPEVVFYKAPPPGQANLSPYAGLQFFGEVTIDRKTRALTVELRDLHGASLFSKTLSAK